MGIALELGDSAWAVRGRDDADAVSMARATTFARRILRD
jgi:hypothetical protein